MRLPIPPPGQQQPIILRFGPFIVKEARRYPKVAHAEIASGEDVRNARANRPRSDIAHASSRRRGARRGERRDRGSPAQRSRGRDDIDPELLPSRVAILEALKAAGVPMPPSDLALAMEVDKRARDAFFGRVDAMQRDGQLLMNRKGELCVTAKLDFITGTVQGHPDGFGFLVPDDGGADLFLSPARDAQGAAWRPRDGARARARIGAAGPKDEIVDVLERANRRRSSAASTRSAASRSSSPRTGGSTRTCSCRRTSAAPRSPATWSSSRSSSSPRRSARPIARVVEVLGRLHRPRHGDRDRAAQARSAARVLARGAQAGRQAARRK